ALFETNCCLRQREVHERAPPSGLESLASCLEDRIGGNRERDLLEDEEPQRIARNIDALPKARGGHQHSCFVGAEGRKKDLFRALSLNPEWSAAESLLELSVQAPHGLDG